MRRSSVYWRSICKTMKLRKAGRAVFYVILLCALATLCLEGIKWLTVDLFHVNTAANLSPPKMEKKVRTPCRKELIDRKNTVKDFKSCIYSDLKNERLTERNVNRTIDFLPLHMKQHFLKCMRARSVIFPDTVEELDAGTWFMICAETIFGWPIASRRFLVAETHEHIAVSPYPHAPVPGQAPAPGPADAPAPAHAPSLPPVPTPAPAVPEAPILPTSAPASTSSASASSASPVSEADVFDLLPPPGHSSHDSEEGKNSIHLRKMIARTIASGAGGLLIIALLCVCFVKRKRKKADIKLERNSDGSLVSMSNLANGSSMKVGSESKQLGNNIGNHHPHSISNLSAKPESGEPSSKGVGPSLSSNPPPGTSSPQLPEPPLPTTPPPPPPPTPPPRSPAPPPKAPQPPPPPKNAPGPPPPVAPNRHGKSGPSVEGETDHDEASKAKLKPFFWDKVLANPDHSMVWHDIRSGSFQFNEETIESLFGYKNTNKKEVRRESLEPAAQSIRIIDPKKAQNLSIILKALNATIEEVVDALKEGNELPVELLQALLKMAPTTDEETKLKMFTGNPSELCSADRFLKTLVEIPFAFKRVESIHSMATLPEEFSGIKESFSTLEVACHTLKESRLFLKLLEAVLKTGNRMNVGTFRGGAQAFRLDTLLKLSDVKGIDGKTTLLHFVVQEIIRSEGVRVIRTAKAGQSPTSTKEEFVDDSNEESEELYRSLGLQVVLGLSNELEDVKNAASIDADVLSSTVSKLVHAYQKMKDFINKEFESLDEDREFEKSVTSFLEHYEEEIKWILEEEKRMTAMIKSTAEYFHGNAVREEGLRLFAIVRDFLTMLDRECKQVHEDTVKMARASKKESGTHSSSSHSPRQSTSDAHQRLFQEIRSRRMDASSSDDENPST